MPEGRQGLHLRSFCRCNVLRRAVELIRNGDDVSRGTLLATLESQTYDELGTFGIARRKRKCFRSKYPDAEGVLIFKESASQRTTWMEKFVWEIF